MLRTIRAAFRIAALDIFAYRSLLFFWAFFDMLYPFSLIFVWLTVYQGQALVGGLTQSQMVLYYVGILIVTTTVSVHSEWDIKDDITHGTLKGYLARPFSFTLFRLVDALTWRLYSGSVAVPLAFLAIAILNATTHLGAPYPVSWQFILALLGSLGVFASMTFCLGYLTFFFERPYSIFHANGTLRTLASGYVLPLSLFPVWAQHITNVLPYKWQYDFPVSVLIGRVDQSAFWHGITLQAGWTILFALGATALWQIGIKRYDAPEQVGRGVW